MNRKQHSVICKIGLVWLLVGALLAVPDYRLHGVCLHRGLGIFRTAKHVVRLGHPHVPLGQLTLHAVEVGLGVKAAGVDESMIDVAVCSLRFGKKDLGQKNKRNIFFILLRFLISG